VQLLLQQVELPDTFGNRQSVKAWLEQLVGSGISPPDALEHISTLARSAQNEGKQITKFWFEDAGRSTNHASVRTQTSASERRAAQASQNIIDGISANARRRDEEDSREFEVRTRRLLDS